MKKTVSLNILVIAAHPDDEVLGCGGTIVKHAGAGDNVWVLILSMGVTSRNPTASKKAALVRKLSDSAKRANKTLGVKKLIIKNLPDNRFDKIPLLSIAQTIEDTLQKFNPDVVYTHSASDVNVDHRLTTDAVQAVVRPFGRKNIKKVLSFEIASSSEVNFTRPGFWPNFFVGLSQKDFAQKIQALEFYSQELKPFPYPRSEEYLNALARVRGGQCGFLLAEGFSVIYCRDE